MKLSKALVALTALSLTAAPIAAQAATAEVAPARVSSEINGENASGTVWVIGILALAAVIAGILAATGSNNDAPTSP